jgi:hypothetical protein
MEIFKSFFDITKLPTKIFLIVSIVAGCFIFLSPEILKKLRLDKFDEYGAFVGLAFLFSTVLVVVNFSIWIFNKINYRYKLKELKAEYDQAIKNLDLQEKAVLREFFIVGQNSINMPINDAVIAGLLQKKILNINRQLSGSTIGTGLTFPLSISKYFYKILTFEDIDLMENPTEIQKQFILDNRPDWVNRFW